MCLGREVRSLSSSKPAWNGLPRFDGDWCHASWGRKGLGRWQREGAGSTLTLSGR